MSNLRLKDHTWDAANVYDSSLGKTQGQINAEVGTSLAGKQATLVSGQNIKRINGNDILGEGNLEIPGGGSVTVDDAISGTSENPVQNKVITKEFTDLNSLVYAVSDGSVVEITDGFDPLSVAGITVAYNDGKLDVYGQASGTRYFCVFNGQSFTANSSTGFQKTLDKGVYKVHVKATGAWPQDKLQPKIVFTYSAFDENQIAAVDGEIVNATAPVMVGVRVLNNFVPGTEEEPAIVEASLERYDKKANQPQVDELQEFADSGAEYFKNGIYIHPLTSLSTLLENENPAIRGGITFTRVSGDKYKFTLSLSGTADDAAQLNLVSGTQFTNGEKIWLHLDNANNPNIYIRVTATGVNYTSSQFIAASNSGIIRLKVTPGTVLNNALVTIAIQSAPSNEELIYEQFPVPAYYEENSYLSDKINAIINRSMSITGDSFIFVTDYHAHKNAGHTPAIINKIYEQAGISKLFCGGDVGTSTGISGMKTNAKALKTLHGAIPNLFACTGNHEWKASDNSSPSGTFNLVYNYYISQMETQISEMSDFGDFWVDSKGAKIRYFFINQTVLAEITNISLKWFVQQLPDVPAGYGIVVITHNAYHNKTYDLGRDKLGSLEWDENALGIRNVNVRRITQILNAIKTGTTVKYALLPRNNSEDRSLDLTPRESSDNCGDYDPIASTFAVGTNTGSYTDIVTFDGTSVKTGVYPIAIFCGHKHEDGGCDPASAASLSDMTDTNTMYLLNNTWYRYDSENTQWTAMLAALGAESLTQIETMPPILTILTTTDCYQLKDAADETVRKVGTTTEQAFDVVQIDTVGRKIYCTRIGGGSDRVFSF